MIDRCQLTYTTPLPLIENRYINVCENKIRIFDKDLKVYYEKWSPIDFSENYLIENVKSRDTFTQYQPVYCGGCIYIQVTNHVYELIGDEFIYIDEIPDLDTLYCGNFYGCLFSLEDVLYACGTDGALFVLENGKFKFLTKTTPGIFFSFCGQTIMWQTDKDIICKILPGFQNDESLIEEICKTTPEIIYISGCLSGIAIFHDKPCDNVILVDVLNATSVTVQELELYVLEIGSFIKLTESGMIIDPEYYVKYLPDDLLQVHNSAFKNYIQIQQSLPNFKRAQFIDLKQKLDSKLQLYPNKLDSCIEQERKIDLLENATEQLERKIGEINATNDLIVKLMGKLGVKMGQ
ncbi:Conserved_hypothetical protein [Hexamita inflata]|uniref:Uncharacterized protein n=1 Tax=Hexamita inflata TaxID=28002 RepID=A0AA86UNW4_9EUKA|nr:Conserved hypothetical protein [Hexamita inflata]